MAAGQVDSEGSIRSAPGKMTHKIFQINIRLPFLGGEHFKELFSIQLFINSSLSSFPLKFYVIDFE